MIHYNGKKWGKSLEALIESKNITDIENQKVLEKAIKMGENVYLMPNPYHANMRDEGDESTYIIWNFTQERVSERSDDLAEQV